VFVKRFVFFVSKLLLTVKITGHFVEQVNNHANGMFYKSPVFKRIIVIIVFLCDIFIIVNTELHGYELLVKCLRLFISDHRPNNTLNSLKSIIL
jgi:hypothetical protein